MQNDEQSISIEEVLSDEHTDIIPKEARLKNLAELAEKFQSIEQWIEASEERVKKQKERLRHISETLIPDIMKELGLKSFTMANGRQVKISAWYSLKITEENAQDAYAWLEANGHGDIVKHSLTIETRMINDVLLNKIRELAQEMKLDTKDKLGIHHMTGSSWAKGEIESGKEVPRDLLGITNGFKTKLK